MKFWENCNKNFHNWEENFQLLPENYGDITGDNWNNSQFMLLILWKNRQILRPLPPPPLKNTPIFWEHFGWKIFRLFWKFRNYECWVLFSSFWREGGGARRILRGKINKKMNFRGNSSTRGQEQLYYNVKREIFQAEINDIRIVVIHFLHLFYGWGVFFRNLFCF